MMAVILFTLGLLFVSLAFVKGSDGWLVVHETLLGLFGWSAFFIGPIFIYIAVMSSMDKLANNSLSFRTTLTVVLLGLISAAFQIFLAGKPEAKTFAAYIRTLYSDGVELHGGGVISAVFGYPLMLLGEPGDHIAVALLIFLLTMILTGTTVASVIRSAQRPMQKISDGYHDFVNSLPQKEQKPAPKRERRIDIPLDDEPPKKKRNSTEQKPVEVSEKAG
ncbi:MAG: hypothetical protein J6C75_07365 [Oscillospiraceae bacterium]|nr:hypothetical protein [Oscillospiraceae bacterium]